MKGLLKYAKNKETATKGDSSDSDGNDGDFSKFGSKKA
jgi:hypothetical protein